MLVTVLNSDMSVGMAVQTPNMATFVGMLVMSIIVAVLVIVD